jgi:hypothetical protein
VIASLGGIAAIVFAVFFAAAMLGLVYVFIRVAGLLDQTSLTIGETRQEIVPMLHEVTGTVQGVNKELERVDGMLESVGNIVKSGERIVGVVEATVSSPLIKVAAAGAGFSRALGRLRKSSDKGKG